MAFPGCDTTNCHEELSATQQCITLPSHKAKRSFQQDKHGQQLSDPVAASYRPSSQPASSQGASQPARNQEASLESIKGSPRAGWQGRQSELLKPIQKICHGNVYRKNKPTGIPQHTSWTWHAVGVSRYLHLCVWGTHPILFPVLVFVKIRMWLVLPGGEAAGGMSTFVLTKL